MSVPYDTREHSEAPMSDTPNPKIEPEPSKVPALTADERLLHSLGYKQEFKREFTAFEVFGACLLL
jgi:hypothetical protein